MGLNLGLEALNDFGVEQHAVLSYEYLDAVMMYNAASESFTVIGEQFDSLCNAYDQLVAISDVLTNYPSSPAMEALLGGNFENGLSLEASEDGKKNVWTKIKDFIIKIWQAIKEFFTYWFSTSKGLKERVEKWIKNADKVEKPEDFDGRAFTGLSVKALGDLANRANVGASGVHDDDVNEFRTVEIRHASIGDAKSYATQLLATINKIEEKKATTFSECDKAIEAAKKIEIKNEAGQDDAKVDKDNQVAKAKAAKAAVKYGFKQVNISAAAFLAHNPLKGVKKDDK